MGYGVSYTILSVFNSITLNKEITGNIAKQA
jgi:hypothetical protein